MKAPVYVLTQNAQPGMLIEVDGERYLVLAVDTDFPTVRYSTPTGMERVEYGAEARVVTISGHPAALPASSVVYAVSRDDREAVEARTETYVAAVKAAVVDPTFDVTTLGLRQTCTECNVHVDRMTEAERAAHEIIDMEVEWFSPWVIVGCEGYWMVNPTAVGMELGNWQDWREIHCGDCAATLAALRRVQRVPDDRRPVLVWRGLVQERGPSGQGRRGARAFRGVPVGRGRDRDVRLCRARSDRL